VILCLSPIRDLKHLIRNTNFHVCNANIKVIDCMIDLVRKLPATLGTARPAHPRCGGIQLRGGPLAFTVTCLDSGITDCSLQTPSQAHAVIKIRLPTDLLKQFRSMVDGVSCDIAIVGQASARRKDKYWKQKRAAQAPRRFSHAVFHDKQDHKGEQY
jgi:hypothetical protein